MRRTPLARFLVLLVLAALVASCGAAQVTPPPSPTPGGVPKTGAELRWELSDRLGPIWHCDPDFYPIARADEADLAIERFDEVRADTEAFASIVAHLGLDIGAVPTAEQKLAIYRAWKQLNAILLDPVGDGTFRFDYLNMPPPGASEGRRTAGTIDAGGSIDIEQQAPAGEPMCPICLARGTRIATPNGEVPIEAIRAGMRVWSIGLDGRRFIATVILTGRTPVRATHVVIRLVLDDGRFVRASPGHPLVDGRPLAAIGIGDRLDGATVVGVTPEAYDGGFTFDLLPDGPTGVYLADGIPLGSTLSGG
jgi:hypothetical protein